MGETGKKGDDLGVMSERMSRFAPEEGLARALLAQDEWPALLVEPATGRLAAVNAASAAAGFSDGAWAPPALGQMARRIAALAPAGVREERIDMGDGHGLRALACMVVDNAGERMVLFCDSRAIRTGEANREEQGVPQRMKPEFSSVAAYMAKPTRFTWETDADGRLVALSESFADSLGPLLSAWRGLTFPDLAAGGVLRNCGGLAEAIAGGETFSDVVVWTCEARPRRIVFGAAPRRDANRHLRAMRGFGVIWPPDPGVAPHPETEEDSAEAATPNVVALRGGTLSARERSAFHEIARTLNEAIGAWPGKPAGAGGPIAGDAARLSGTPDEAEEAPSPLLPGRPEPAIAALQEDTLLDRLPVGVLVEQRGKVVRINRALLGWSGAADMAAFLRAGGLDAHLACSEEGDAVAAPDGGRTPVELRIVSAPWNGADARVYVLRNLTGMVPQRPETPAVPPPQSRNGLIRDRLPFPLLVLDRSGRIAEVNTAAERLSGFAREELNGEPFSLLLAPGARGEAHALLDRAEGAVDGVSAPLRIRHRSGTERTMAAVMLRLEAAPGQVALLLRPATAGPAPEHAPARPPPDAPPAAEPRRDLDGLVRRVSHDLRDSLNGVLGFIDAMHAAAFGPVGNVRYTKQAAMALEAGRRLLEQLQDMEQLVAAPVPTISVVDLDAVVSGTVAHVQASILRRRLLLRQDLLENVTVRGHAPALSRLLRLILEEAIRATPAGGQVFLSTRLEVGTGGERMALLLVRDGGPGLTEEEIAQVLDFTAPAPVSDRMSSAGLPLRLARIAQLARACGARFDLRRGVQGGLLSELRLPL